MSVVARIKDHGLLVGVISGDEFADPAWQQSGSGLAEQPVPGLGVNRVAHPDHQASSGGDKPCQPGRFEPVKSRDIAQHDAVVSIEVLAHEAAFGDHGGCDSWRVAGLGGSIRGTESRIESGFDIERGQLVWTRTKAASRQ